MTDSSTHTDSDGRRRPAPTFFDPSFERLPASVSGENATPGPVVLIFDPDADREWLADAAVALATGWHAAGRRTVLADLSLEDPFLHERIGMPNQDGVVDVFLYGASLARCARPVPGRGFYLISSGTYTPEPEEILRHPRWGKLVQGFREAGAALLLLVPRDAPGFEALVRWGDAAVALGPPPAEEGGSDFVPHDIPVRAWLAPPADARTAVRATAPPAAAERFPAPGPAAAGWAPPPASETARRGGGPELPSAEAAVGAPVERIPVPEPEWTEEREAEPARRKVSPVLVVVLLLVVLLAAYVLAAPYLGLPGFAGEEASEGVEPVAPVASAPRPPPAPAGVELPYSVHVRSFPELAAATREMERVSARYPEAQFFVVPEEREGLVYYKIFAGMAGDTADVLALRERLLEEGVIDPQSVGGRWGLIQHRPIAFDLGEYPTASAARARLDSLAARGIPSYLVPVPYSDGTERWRVYGGAFQDTAGAAALQRMLSATGAPGELVERAGRPPAAPK